VIIAHAVMRMRGRFTNSMRDDQRLGSLRVKPYKLSLRCKPKWHSLIPNDANLEQARAIVKQRISITQSHNNQTFVAGSTLVLLCPSCVKAVDVALNPFRNGSWQPVHCSSCQKDWPVKQWQCTCKMPWRHCARHNAVAGALPTKRHHQVVQAPVTSGWGTHRLRTPELSPGAPERAGQTKHLREQSRLNLSCPCPRGVAASSSRDDHSGQTKRLRQESRGAPQSGQTMRRHSSAKRARGSRAQSAADAIAAIDRMRAARS
jgi:hypothetical protein